MRPDLSPHHPVHVVLRFNGNAARRNGETYRAIRSVLAALLGVEHYRIVHISIQGNHLHLLVEARDRSALSELMQRFSIRAARAIHASSRKRGHLARGKVFAFRYHATQITTPRQARNALAYVLNNWRRHREDVVNATTRAALVDPYSSGVSFDGWAGVTGFKIPAYYDPLPVSPPQTRLLRSDWRAHGLLDLFERPGPQRWW